MGKSGWLEGKYPKPGTPLSIKAAQATEFAVASFVTACVDQTLPDGSVLAHRNRYWRMVDFLLMLHFMDYVREHRFNNLQIIFIAFTALWLTISGAILVIRSFNRRNFTWKGITR